MFFLCFSSIFHDFSSILEFCVIFAINVYDVELFRVGRFSVWKFMKCVKNEGVILKQHVTLEELRIKLL